MTRKDATLDEGRDVTLTVTLTDSAGDPITAAAATYSLFTRAGTTALLSKTLDSGISQAAGVFTITLADTDLDGLHDGLYYHELMVTDGAGKEYTAFRGSVALEVSRV